VAKRRDSPKGRSQRHPSMPRVRTHRGNQQEQRNAWDTEGYRGLLRAAQEAAEDKGMDWRSNSAFRRFARLVAVLEIEDLENLYKATSNPLCAWHAYQRARQNELPTPAWVLRYLAKVAENLTAIEKPATNSHAAIAAALGMWTDSRGNIFTQFSESRRRFLAVSEMVRRKEWQLGPMSRRERAEHAAASFDPHKPPSHWTVEAWHTQLSGFVGRLTTEMELYEEEVCPDKC
jgi:hypothetical protein